MSQVTTKHSLCPYYIKRFNLRNCNCRCGEDADDGILHYLFWCPLLSNHRTLLRPGLSIPQVLQDKRKVQEAKTILNVLFLHHQDIFEYDQDDPT
ncbi:hypothetical protein AVEN_216245-1 [Araneus ventricosus]|uniref:Uncharacterized protein n=1 Tax=Araneus ventricosus TaxID=182803 RepID=A0A4Y2HQW2_ARAVE|nr:hypothetical protein AVEN_216245-1 [Araneus ventricosus]